LQNEIQNKSIWESLEHGRRIPDGKFRNEFERIKNNQSILLNTIKEAIKSPSLELNVRGGMIKPKKVLDTLNPTNSLFVDYTPQERITMKLGDNITTLDKTSKKPPETMITIYRGASKIQKQINAGDLIMIK